VASELNRDELAARCLVALAGVEDDGPPELARIAVEYADALLARLASRPASTGSADGDARDKAGGGSLDKPTKAPLDTYNLDAVKAAFPVGCKVRVIKAVDGQCGEAHPVGAVRTVAGYDSYSGVRRLLVQDNKGWVLYCEKVERVNDQPAPVAPVSEAEPLASQVNRLADFIMANIPGEPSRSEGAVDTAIRLLAAPVAPAIDREGHLALLAAVDWVLNDAAFKAPEQMGQVAERWVARLSRAMDTIKRSRGAR